jgi:hypothetical protein
MTTESVPKFQTPWIGQQKPVRTFGLRVHPEEVKRVDAFRFAFPEGSKTRTLIEEALVKGKEGKPEGITDREYFTVLGRSLMDGGAFEIKVHNDIIRMVLSMPASVQGDAYRVALDTSGEGEGKLLLKRFNAALIKDSRENVPGEKEEQIMQAARRHVQAAQMEGKISRGGPGLIYDFGERLGKSSPETVNLLYYGQDSVESMLETSMGMKDFLMTSTAVREWLIDAAEEISFFAPERRIYVLRAFAEDLKAAAHDRSDIDYESVGRMIREIRTVYALHGAGLL